jgi:hemerythrin-like domain-containing protein
MSVRTGLLEDHRSLEKLFERLLEAIESNDRDRIRALWSTFERRLGWHIDLESRALIPELRKENAAEAEWLVNEHESIRRGLLELGTAVDLHMLRYDAARALIEEVREHTAHEDAVLYRWADATLSPNDKMTFAQAALRTIRQLLGADHEH